MGLEIRNEKYKRHALNSNRSSAVWYSNPPLELHRIIIAESAIDALSYHEIKGQPNDLYISFGGNLTSQQIKVIKDLCHRQKNAPNLQWVMITDNDKYGAQYDLKTLRDLISETEPSQQISDSTEYTKLIFPAQRHKESQFIEFSQKIMNQLKSYNERIDEICIHKTDLKTPLDKINSDKFNFKISNDQFIVEIPNNFFSLSFFNKSLIRASASKRKILIDKAFSKDYNEDLQLTKAKNSLKINTCP